jgi:hypothetical protein
MFNMNESQPGNAAPRIPADVAGYSSGRDGGGPEAARKAEAQLPIDVLALQNADEAMQGDIKDSKEGMDAIDVIDHIPKTKEADSSVDKLEVPDLSKINFTSLQDVEGDFNLEDTLEYALSLVECEHTTTISLERIDEATFTNGTVVNDMVPHEPNPGKPFQRIGAPTKPWLEGHFMNIYADHLSVSDASGTSRRVLLEGESVTVSNDDFKDLPDLAAMYSTGL